MNALEHHSYAWLAARARNALRRRAMTSIVASTVFVGTLIGLVLIPRQASRAVESALVETESRPDSVPTLEQRARLRAELSAVDSALDRAREAALASAPATVIDTVAPELRSERDSLEAQLEVLATAMTRAANSPLPPAFRALGRTPALRGDARVRGLLDSLDEVDKLREPFGALGAGDPIYVALTARVNEIGRSIRDAASLRRSELRARIAPLKPTPVSPALLEARVDTVPLLTQKALKESDVDEVNATLNKMREQNTKIDANLKRARDLANLGAPPLAMLAAALVISLVVGFSSAFAAELRYPRLAHLKEAAAVTGVRVLTVIRPVEVVERDRRQTDVGAPPLIDVVSESYRVLYLYLAATDASVPVVTITGDVEPIVATIASNLAAAAAYEARSTLLVDTDTVTNTVAAVLRISPEPGLMGVLTDKVEWSDAIVSTTIGRDRPLEVLPSGHGRLSNASPDAVEHVRTHLLRLEQRYDFVVVAAPTSYVQQASNTVIPTQDVILCAKLGETRIADLRASVRSLHGVGRKVHGVVLWDDETPRL